MSEIVRGESPAESGAVSTGDALAAAAQAFKVELGQEAPAEAEGDGDQEEIDAAVEAEGAEAGAESLEEGEAEAEAPDMGQPEALALPQSWPSDKAELWNSLPPEAQTFINERDGQMKAAIGAKFEEAADLRKAHAAEIEAAKLDRQRYAEAVDQVLSLVVPQPPSRSMLDRNSDDYDPDGYHYRKALHEDTVAFLNGHAGQRQQIAALVQAEQFDAINGATREAFMRSVPDVADQAKAPAIFRELIDYAVSLGTPADLFSAPTTALEWHVLWKAREYDRLQSAKARVREAPRPEPRKAPPAVRPGTATSRSAIEQAKRQGAMDRLRKEGSIEAGAAALKHLLKGNHS